MALASRGKRVALLDMDFKKPSIHKIFALQKPHGEDFASLLSGKTALAQYKPYPYKQNGIDLMVNFKPHKDYVYWIHGNITREIFHTLKNDLGYDYILIDTPPLSVAADVTTFMDFADKALVVIRTDYVLAADINDAILSIKEKTDIFAGCILNAVHKEFSLFGQFGLDETGNYGKTNHYYKKYNQYASRHFDDNNNKGN